MKKGKNSKVKKYFKKKVKKKLKRKKEIIIQTKVKKVKK